MYQFALVNGGGVTSRVLAAIVVTLSIIPLPADVGQPWQTSYRIVSYGASYVRFA